MIFYIKMFIFIILVILSVNTLTRFLLVSFKSIRINNMKKKIKKKIKKNNTKKTKKKIKKNNTKKTKKKIINSTVNKNRNNENNKIVDYNYNTYLKQFFLQKYS